MKAIQRLTGQAACEYVAGLLKIPPEEFASYYWKFDWTTRPSLEVDPANWSMPEWEAAMLYAITRATKPKTILELGTYLGYSAACMLDALEENGHGRIVTLDFKQQMSADSKLATSYRVFPLTCDGLAFSRSLAFPVDMIFEDGSYTVEVTSEFLKNCLPHLKSDGIVIAHDVAFPEMGELVTEGLRLSLGEDVERIVIENSPCGLGLWVKP
jgi:predicted O-methyltransferase YrrM